MRAHVRTSNRMHQSAIVLVRCVPGSFSNLRHIGKREDPGDEVAKSLADNLVPRVSHLTAPEEDTCFLVFSCKQN